MAKPVTRIVQLRRVRDHGHRKHVTLWLEIVGACRWTGKPLDRVLVEHMQPFEGEEGWFLVERVPKGMGQPWPYWRMVRQVEPPQEG
jgi:hypothetical protein